MNSAISSIVVDPCTGLLSVALAQEDISIYPNPTNNFVTLSGVEGSATIELYNVLGKIVLSQKITKDKTEIDLSKETNGVYFIKIITENNSVTKKIIKE